MEYYNRLEKFRDIQTAWKFREYYKQHENSGLYKWPENSGNIITGLKIQEVDNYSMIKLVFQIRSVSARIRIRIMYTCSCKKKTDPEPESRIQSTNS